MVFVLDTIDSVLIMKMDIKYFGDNLIPGINVKNINAGVINPLMNAGAAVSQAYGQYGKNLRQGLGLEQDNFSQQFLAGKLKKEDKKPIEGFDTLTAEETEEAIKLSNQSVPDTTKGPKLDPNATKQYASNFKAGEANKDAMQDYFKGQKNGDNLALWAEANPALAYKAYTKGVAKEKAQDQRDLMSDYRVMNQDVSKGEGFNKAEFDAIHGGKGGSVAVDIDGSGVEDVRINPQAQAFKDNAQMSLINTLNNKNITPIVEGMELPDMSKYAGIFNQTDAPDYKTMMENAAMTQLAENIGLPVNTYNTGNYFERMFGK